MTSGFVHHASIYGSDDEFLAMALPFISGGLAKGEPVLAATTSANLELLNEALGEQADQVDYAETAYFGRRPPQRVAAFHEYWLRHAAASAHGQVRILAEPVWAGRSRREVSEWRRMESGLNAVLAPANIWMICPYDTRVVDPAIAADALRTHPAAVSGQDVVPCDAYTEPAAFAAACDAVPLPEPPARADLLRITGVPADLRRLRRFAAAQATAHGLSGERAAMLVLAVDEAATCLIQHGAAGVTVRGWAQGGRIVLDLGAPLGPLGDPFLGYRPPQPGARAPEPGEGLWLARQACEAVDVRSTGAHCAIRLHLLGQQAEGARQSLAAF
jgi:anti-sigma regulatory factor (Ser/Thr protein kinase)